MFERWRKPFNPILGETWQARLSDGSSIFLEQICHHPPVSAFHMDGPGEIRCQIQYLCDKAAHPHEMQEAQLITQYQSQ
jgi:hypothetical protein